MRIGNIDLDKNILIVAEIGNNHEGSLSLAEEMIGMAARAGAGAVKFQTMVPEKLVCPSQRKRIEQLRKYQLSQEQFEKLARTAKREGILFLSTPFDIDSATFLEPLVPAFKIASGDNDFYPLINVVARTGKPLILSSGMSDLNSICKSRDYIWAIWKELGVEQELAILHCVASYPTPSTEANLLAIEALKGLDVTPGYSDHMLGVEASVLAAGLGARIIEKHFTIRRDYSDFHDHRISADPKEMKQLVERVKQTIELLGDGEKRINESEMGNLVGARRSIVASRDLQEGSVITWDDIDWLRPGGGISPGRESELVDKVLKRNISKGEMIGHDDVCSKG